VIRPDGDDVRLMISDATAAGDWPVAREALDLVDEPQPEDDEAAAPAGDLDIFADLGIDSMELVAVCSDLEAYPDEMLGQVAARIGFGPQFESVVDDDLT
jgi:putative tRNA adenosine deaminase-associated protein